MNKPESSLTKKRWKKIVSCCKRATINKTSLVKFLTDESALRKQNRKDAVTKNLNQTQWKELRKQIKSRTESDACLKELRNFMMYWILEPSLEGAKPSNFGVLRKKFENIV